MYPTCILAGGLVALYTNRRAVRLININPTLTLNPTLAVRLSPCPTSTCALADSGASRWTFRVVRPVLAEQHGQASH